MLIGLTGVGGGSLMTPLLLLAGGYSPAVTIGTDLAYGAVTKTFGGWRHLRAGHVDARLSWWLAAGSVPGALAGVVTLNRLDDAHGKAFEPYLLGAVAAALVLAASATLYRALFRPEVIARERASAGLQRPRSKAATVLIGLVLGFILGLTSVGSGALVGLALILLYRPGVWIGAALLPYVPVAGLRHALGIILAAAALGVLTKAGVSLSPAAVVGIPAALAVVSVVVHRVDRARVREQNRSTRR